MDAFLLPYRPLLLWGLILIAFPARAQVADWEFEVVEIPGGSKANEVACIVQDSLGYLWFASSAGLHRYDGHQFKTFLHDPSDSTTLSDNHLEELFVDRQGVLWIGTQGGNLERYNPENETFTSFIDYSREEASLEDWIIAIAEDKLGQLWVGTLGNGVLRFDRNRRLVKRYLPDPNDPNSLAHDEIADILVDDQGTVWICAGWYPSGRSKGGLHRYRPDNDDFERFVHDPADPNSLEENVVWTAFEDSRRNFWVGTSGDGLHQMDRTTGAFKHFHYDPSDPQQLSMPHSAFPMLGNAENVGVRRIFEDRDGNIWILSFDRGMAVYSPATGKVFRYQNASSEQAVGGNVLPSQSFWNITQARDGSIWIAGGGPGRILKAKPVYGSFRHIEWEEPAMFQEAMGITEDSRGNIWIGSYGSGLLRYDRNNDQFTRFNNRPDDPNSLSGNSIWTIYEDKNEYLWVGTFNSGLNRYDPKTGAFKRFLYNAGDSGSIADDFISTISEDPAGNLWIGSKQAGLSLYHPETESFTRYFPGTAHPVSGPAVEYFFTDSKKRFWVLGGKSRLNLATQTGSGFLDLWDPEQRTFIPYFSGERGEISGKAACMMAEAPDGSLWFAAREGGLHKFHADKKVIEYYNPQEGNFPEWDVRWIVSDAGGKFWIGCSQAVYHFDPRAGTYDRYDIFTKNKGGNIAKEVIYNDRGELIFSWGSGFYIFHPERYREVAEKQAPPELLLYDISIFGSDTNAVTQRLLYKQEEVRLAYYQNNFNIGIRNFHFMEPQTNRIEYRLEPYETQWRTLSGGRPAEYFMAPPGSYTLRARGITSEGLQSEELSLRIIISPPWWRTWWAYLLYGLTTLGLLYAFYRFQLGRQLARREAERLKEMDSFKTRLYTNVTHEFRTPLTVILGMTEQIRRRPENWLHNGLETIERNGRQLLKLVNQMLDLSKLDAGKLEVHWQRGDLVAFASYVVQSFQSFAATKQIQLEVGKPADPLITDFDAGKLEIILSNLISNAVKYSPEGSNVRVRISEGVGEAIIEVADQGIGIPAGQLPHIFDRFYQVDASATRQGEGTGIGLALTKELVEVLRGTIAVESAPGKGTTFTIRLPLRRGATSMVSLPVQPVMPAAPVPHQPLPAMAPAEAPTALIMEDNPDVVQYLTACLQPRYRIETAGDGEAGIGRALELVPDIIICDVMMPKKDGFEVCATLKEDERTSHIPIILLTAKADDASRREGLRRGADAYLVKPFDKAELDIRLQKLIELRRRLREKYGSIELEQLDIQREQDPELLFLKKLETVILDNLSDEDFRVEPDLCRAMTMSRPQLYRKLKALKDQSPSEFIRDLRMQQARQLLLNSNLPIGEIADRVGFRQHSYFTVIYTETFGETPSETRMAGNA